MVAVPVTPGRSVQVRPEGRDRLNYAAPRNSVGPAIEGFGQAMGKAAEAWDEIKLVQDDANRLELRNQLHAKITDTRTQFKGLRGKAPDDNLEETYTGLTKYAEELLTSARSPRARSLAKIQFDQLLLAARDDMTTHANSQMFEFHAGQLEAKVKLEAQAAVDSHDAPDFLVNLISGQETRKKQQSLHGWSDEETADAVASYTSNVHRRVIEKLQAQGKTLEAEAWREKYQAEIIDTDETEVWQSLQPALEEHKLDQGMDRLDEIMAGEPGPAPPAAIQEQTAEVNSDPLRGRGRVTTTPQQHLKRGRLAIDLAAPPGTPIYPPMSGKVTEKGYDPKGNGHFIRVKHPNGYTSTFLHMRGASPLNKGDEVTAGTILGGVGSTGKSTGPHLDYSVRDARGRPVNPQTVAWKETGLPAYQPDRSDKANLYEAARQVATERNYSRREYEALLKRVDARVAREDGLRARVEEDETEAAMTALASLEEAGGKLTRRDQIPNFGRLPARVRLQLMGMIEANTRPKEIDANGDRVLSLELMSVYEPESFAKQDLRLFRHEMTPAEFSSLAMKQGEIRTKGPKAPIAVGHGQIWTTINRYGVDVGLKPNSDKPDERSRTMRVFDLIRIDLQRITDGKRTATDDEVKAAFDRATMEVLLPDAGWFGRDKTARRFDVQPGQQAKVVVPNDVRDRIIGSFQRSMGRRPSEVEIGNIFIAQRGQPGFW